MADSKIYSILEHFSVENEKLEERFPLEECRKQRKELLSKTIKRLSPESFNDLNQYVFITGKATKKLSFEKCTKYDHTKAPIQVYEKHSDGEFYSRKPLPEEREQILSFFPTRKQNIGIER